MSSLLEIVTALADQLRSEIEMDTDAIQIEPRFVTNPTPPTLDVYPGDPFQTGIGFGDANNEIRLTIRARINTPDEDAAYDVLLSLVDPSGGASVALAVASDRTLNGKVENVATIEGPSQFGIFQDLTGQGAYLGCTWTLTVTP